jgi:hypothetical protein
MKKELNILIGYIGHKAEKLQELFGGDLLREANEYGFFLRFDNITDTGNEGVRLWTNHFESEEHFYEQLNTKLLFLL